MAPRKPTAAATAAASRTSTPSSDILAPVSEKVEKSSKAKASKASKASTAAKSSTAASKSATGDKESEQLILDYLNAQNRPYSATDVSSNLHNKVTKAKCDKLLKDMCERGEVAGKNAGKAWVFWRVQDPNDAATPEQLAAWDTEIAALREKLPGLKIEHKAKGAALAALREQPSMSALKANVAQLEQRKREMTERLEKLLKGEVKAVSEEERERVAREERYWKSKGEARARAWREVEGMVLEGGVGRQELMEKLGIDDEGED